MSMENKDTNIKRRYFGQFGGRYVPEMLIPALDKLEDFYFNNKDDPDFKNQLKGYLKNYAGRPSPLCYAENLTKKIGGCKIYLKLEAHNHTGSHKINNTLGQVLLAKKMGKTQLIAETGAGQHGLATATVAAKFGLDCRIFMGEKDMARQYPNVYAMKLLGAEVIPVTSGTRTLKDAVNAALKYWIEHLQNTYYLLGSVVGPYPYPLIVRDFQSIIGREVKQQIMELENRLPDILVACVGGGSNSLGLFHPFLKNKNIELFGIEAGGYGTEPGSHAARFTDSPTTGIVQGYKSYFLQNENGQILPTHSISPGLDYAGVGPELAHLYNQGRITFSSVSDKEALEAFRTLSREEGIIPALESAHAVSFSLRLARKRPEDAIMVINISGRGDKDIFITAKELDNKNWIDYLKSEVKNDKSDK